MAARKTRSESAPEAPSRIATVAPLGDRRASLEAIRDRLALETDDTRWAKHKAECRCTCGMGDGRVLVAEIKELRAVMAELETLPTGKEKSTSDDLAARRAARLAEAAGQ